ncbi:MAG: glycoside hydrolase family 172 protein [Chitinophagaceae bacterium]
MKSRPCWMILIMFISVRVLAQQPVSVGTLLAEMTDAASVASRPSYTMKQASSYDRRSVSVDSPGWYANTDQNQFIRKEEINGHTEYVMMDAEGPGAIVRYWLTTVIKPGKIRFYLDNATQPTFETTAYDLMKMGFNLGPALLNPHSSYEPNGKGGNTLYFPIPYQQHCKVTLELPDSAAIKAPHYYQINYRTYIPATRVRSFTMNDLQEYRTVIDRAESELWNPPVPDDTRLSKKSGLIKPSKQISVELPRGSAAIRSLVIRLSVKNPEKLAEALRSVILKIDFDGQQTVSCPLGDFSGSGYGGKPVKSWYRELDSNATMTSRWVMPYQRNATITVLNSSGSDVNIELSARTGIWNWQAGSMYFHATYKQEENIRDAKWDYDPAKLALTDSSAPIEWKFIRIKGGGIYLGNTLAVNNHMPTWYGEGDAKIWVDDDHFPSEFGTGLEDYYNTSWAPVVLYQTPFANAPRADNASSFGHNTFTRTRNLDGVPFNHSFRYDLEMLSWDGGKIDAAAVTYWYGLPGAKAE